MPESIQEKLKRVRAPRVHITYDVETEGARVIKELPFVMGVIGDFSGESHEGASTAGRTEVRRDQSRQLRRCHEADEPRVEDAGEKHDQGRRHRDPRGTRVQFDERFRAGQHHSAGRTAAAGCWRCATGCGTWLQGRPQRGARRAFWSRCSRIPTTSRSCRRSSACRRIGRSVPAPTSDSEPGPDSRKDHKGRVST